jgi:hypothetical protein
MKMPSGLIIQSEKLTRYILVYQEKADKSQYLVSAGYSLKNWQVLKEDRIQAVEGAEVAEVKSTDWGMRFTVRSRWQGTNSQFLEVVTIWQQDEGTDIIRFVTLYPDKLTEG